MVAVKIQNFGGMIPVVDSHLLPPNSAARAVDTWVKDGSLYGFKDLVKIHDYINPVTSKVFRVPIDKPDIESVNNSYWIELATPNADFIRSSISTEAIERFYWVSDIDVPRYNTRPRIANGDPALILGMPPPDTAPGVGVTGGSTPTESRAYVYTWVSLFGEESPPSPPTLFTGNADGVWNITMTAPGAIATGRLLDKVRIYRTVTGVGGETDYFFVDEQTVADTTYDDSVASVTNNRLLETLFFTPPPSDLVGFAEMPNGIVAGWRDNEVWFCEPYRPHAWPPNYQISVPARIVGLGVVNQTLIICTEGATYAATGINPGSMAQARLPGFEPCMSRGSIVSTPAGVAYASPNGIVIANPGAAPVVTSQFMDKNDWVDLLYLRSSSAAMFDSGYFAFGSTAIGCFDSGGFDNDSFLQLDLSGAFSGVYIDPSDQRIAVSEMTSPEAVRSVYTDLWTNEVFIARDDGLYLLDQTKACAQPRQEYLWKSKIMEAPAGKNFAAMRVYFSTFPCSPELLSPRNTDLNQTLAADQWGIVRVYADGVLRMARELRKNGEFFRLPSGFKATFWQIEIEARIKIESVELATTAMELRSV